MKNEDLIQKINIIEKLIKEVKTFQQKELKLLRDKIGAIEILHELELKPIHEKINKIVNVKINGSEGLEECLKVLYEVTRNQRSNKTLFDAIKVWLEEHKKIKLFILSDKIKNILYGIFTFIILEILNYIGVFPEFIKIIKYILNISPN